MIVMRKSMLLIVALSATIPLIACGGPEGTLFNIGQNRVNLAGANQLFEPEEVEEIDLVALLQRDLMNPRDLSVIENPATRLAYALGDFYREPDDQKRRRNQIQDSIIMASNQRCNLYFTYMQRIDSETGFYLGSLATLLGGLGSIFTDADVARTLAGAAGITSGINAHRDLEYFRNLTVNVITEGINKRRGNQFSEMQERWNDELQEYTVEAAIADAIQYHGSCSILAGLEEASDELSRPDRFEQLESDINEINRINTLIRDAEQGGTQ